ncbi:hypothetical protein ANN_06182 [Periplaneta americana]|uniref:Inositol polyphosphate-related phosphatase domain-containing protein n=1 Tax=Periplaneta americana TaxID=6978 RepID=A0ABQ8TFB0_PERAM|nr:hypothetical protein ANN_06182 [Periplaneta americana]
MEMCDDDTIDQCSKLKPKKKSLCRLLMQKKTKVGCLSTESEEINLQENVQNNWPIKQKDAKEELLSVSSPVKKIGNIAKAGDNQNKDTTQEINEIHRLGSPKDFSNSTKLSLCCAMTESSRSLNHQLSANYHRSNSTDKSNQNERNVIVAAVSEAEIVSRKMQSVNKASSVDETRLSAARLREISSELNHQENSSQSVPVSRQPSLRISQSPSPSEISSCDSSPPMQMSSHARLRRRLLSQRRSADNLLISSTSCPSPSLRHSSPDSSRSAPEPLRGYKKRSSSHDTMLPPQQDGKDKKLSIPSRGSHGNLNPENGAVRGIVASMDSLARHSLLAAQVLHLIPTTKARERNFLHGRIAATSLLGLVELERTLPQRELRIFVGTWNMNGQAPPPQLNDFMLPDDLEHVPDVIAVGTQESFSERFEWEVSIQETVGPSHLLLHSATLGTLHLAIYIRRDLLWFCSDRIRNESVLERVGEERMMLKLIRKRKKKWLVHRLRRNCLWKNALKGMVDRRRFLGRKRYQIIEDIKIYGSYAETKKKAENRKDWNAEFAVKDLPLGRTLCMNEYIVAEEASFSVRPGTAFKTKGAVAIAFMLFGTSYLFITSHLTAHLDKVKERIQDVRRIVRSLDLPKQLPVRHKSKDVTQNFDCVFWCGDLNFRLSQPRDEVVQWVAEQRFPLPQPLSLQSDQLRNSRIEGSVFREFEEGPITFPPTYKYDPGTQRFDTSHKQRAPAYTDRILFKSKSTSHRRDSAGSTSGGPLECLMYTSVPSICTSDHKPVWGLYRSTVRPGIDTIPLAAGLFNREVYLEGIKRRAAAMDKRKGTSTICSLQ